MSTHSQNYNHKNPNDFNNHVFLLVYIMLNGISVSGAFGTTKDIINGQTDSSNIIALLLWVGVTAHTAKRAIDLYKRIYNNKDNQK